MEIFMYPVTLRLIQKLLSKRVHGNFHVLYSCIHVFKLFRFTLAGIEIPEKGKHLWRWWMIIFLPLRKLAALWPCILATLKGSQ